MKNVLHTLHDSEGIEKWRWAEYTSGFCGHSFSVTSLEIILRFHQKFNCFSRYLVKLKDSVSPYTVDRICANAENSDMYPGYCLHRYKNLWLGMLMVTSGHHLAQLAQKEASVIDHIEVDGIVRISAMQKNPPWGLDRIDHRLGEKTLNSLYNVTSDGDGVHVYILDTGIRCTHQEFWYADGRNDSKGNRLTRCLGGFDGIGDGNGTNDCNGHGTHCAGIIAGLRSGVAKASFVHPIRAMACDGTGNFGAILAALEWISYNIIRPAVLSMSLTTQPSISIDQAVNRLVNATGIFAVAAAGNSIDSTCNYSPSRTAGVMSVASTNSADSMSWFSNYGNCTSIFAPGELISSAYKDSDTSFTTLSGTSMACPHVAGTAALYLSGNIDARPSEVRQSIMDASETNAISQVKPNTTNRLLNVNMQSPPISIHPRSLYGALEGSTNPVIVKLITRPSSPVTLSPYFSDSSIGYFSPSQLVFQNDSTWSYAQIINIVVTMNSDFYDHTSLIQWAFTSRDIRFAICPEGVLVSLDTGVCKYTAANPCGQTLQNPKIIPSLPFAFYDDSSRYSNVYDTDFDSCHSSGPDVVFQYTATVDMIVNVTLCGSDTEYDTMLVVYSRNASVNGDLSRPTKVACNDDFCMAASGLSSFTLLKGRVYIFMIDGYEGDEGPFDFYINIIRSIKL